MSSAARPIPEGYHALTPHLTVAGANQAIEFYKTAFGAEEISRMPAADGRRLLHAELRIGDSMLMLCDSFPEMGGRDVTGFGGSPVTIHLYVDDVDTVVERAVAAGATVRMPVADMFWGDRYGKIADPFGHEWSIATHLRDLTPEEMERAAAEAMKEWPR